MNSPNASMSLVFKGLADSHRIKILEILLLGEECNCRLSEKMNMPLSTLAHHLRVLVNAELVLPRKDGKWTYYKLNHEQFTKAQTFLGAFR